MTKVGLLSDTHGYWDEKYLQYFEGCDEIWHAGDIGSLEVAQKLAAFRPFRAVYGNIDGQEIRHILKVKYDKTLDVLHINPGAAGIQGFHKVRTMVRFAVDGGTFKDLEVIELADR